MDLRAELKELNQTALSTEVDDLTKRLKRVASNGETCLTLDKSEYKKTTFKVLELKGLTIDWNSACDDIRSRDVSKITISWE